MSSQLAAVTIAGAAAVCMMSLVETGEASDSIASHAVNE
jgi:hypothetical protein